MSSAIEKILKNSYTRLLLSVFLGLVALCLYFNIVIYNTHVSDSQESELAKIQGVARSTASVIKAEDIQNTCTKYPKMDAIKDNMQDSIYYKNVKLLKEIQHRNNIKTPVYVLVFDEKSQHFLFVYTSNDNPYYFHTYTSFPEELLANYKANIGGIIPPYEDEHGTWMSAFEPIKDENGTAIGIVQVDAQFDPFIQEARVDAFKQLGIASFIFIIIGFALYKKIQTFLDDEEENQRTIHQKNLHITSSIQYAKRIQEVILPTEEQIAEELQNFVYYEPKDIVSGDFYWFSNKQENHVFLAAVDCTGHGVPGAFMSMIGNTVLNTLINEKKLSHVGEILKQMEVELRKALNAEDKNKATTDGMDIALIHIDKEKNKICFAGAQRPLVMIRENEIKEIKATKRSIGYLYHDDVSYNTEEIPLEKGDCFYMFSDGYQDQFGGPKNKKFMKKQLKRLLLEIHEQDMPTQKTILHEKLQDWKGGHNQIDDVLVMGIRI
ncbi:MAG: SpoIIE family protein phosphatase [Cytophagales bacterium]|nr:SpoIIE family protein phosphatase [Cytophagales bacterium]